MSCTGGWSVLQEASVDMQLCAIPDIELWVSPATDEIIECRREGDFVGITVETFTVADIVWQIYASDDQTKMMYDLDVLISGLRRLRDAD
ncbi:MAG: hypothetical protein ACHQTE_02315 [Candidatus Saccharimonadales bacterium]